jgi:GST-like protein
MYLAKKSGKLLPTDSEGRFAVLQWLLFENSKMGPSLANTKHFMYHAPEEIPYAIKRFNTEAKRIFNILNKQLAENDFLASDYSIADIAAFPWISEYERYGIMADDIPYLIPWLERMTARSAVKKGLVALDNLKD